MSWAYCHYKYFLLLQRGDRLQPSESDVYRRQILTTKVAPRAVGVKDTAIQRTSALLDKYSCYSADDRYIASPI